MSNKISIIIPCHNLAEYIRETIASVKAQTSDNWECIIVDDGSLDKSAKFIDEATIGDPRFKVFHTQNKGVAAARNLAIANATGRYILPLDADDILMPEAIERFTEGWRDNPGASLLVPMIQHFGMSNQTQDRKWHGYKDLMRRCTPTNSSCFRRYDWGRVGGYRHETMYEDWEFWLRLLYKNDAVVNIPEVLIKYRVRQESRYRTAVKRHKEELEILRQLNPLIFGEKQSIEDIPRDHTVLVVIPYLAKGAQGCELELAVAGWRKHFKERYLIVVVGDWDPVVETGDDIIFINCPQINPVPGQYLPHLDHVHKFREVRKYFPDSAGFIYTCDDIYATSDFTLRDVMIPKMPVRGFYFGITHCFGGVPDWLSDKQKTGDLCFRAKLPVRNWVCHLPVYYEWERLIDMYDRYNCDNISYIAENIYFNEKYPDEIDAFDECDYHDEVKTEKLNISPIGSVMWISNSIGGWSKELEDVLRKHYGLLGKEGK